MRTHKNMTNKEIANLLEQVAAIFQIKKDDLFRQRAYENASVSIKHLSTEVKDLWEQHKLQSIPGVGPNLANHLDELFRTGKVKHFETLAKNLPQGMFPLLDLPGVGAKTAYKLAKKLKLTDPKTAKKKLQQAAKQGKIRQMEGFAQESETSILQNIKEQKQEASKAPRMRLDLATEIASDLTDYLKKVDHIKRIDTMGSLRRRNATVRDIDLGVATTKPKVVIKHFVHYPQTKKILAQGENTARIELKNHIQVDLKTQTPDKYGALLQHFTGSKKHNIALRELALKKGLSLSEYGIKKQTKSSQKIASFANEKDFYKALGINWIPPELREDTGEIDIYQKGQGPKLIELSDLKGDLHTHSDYGWKSSHDYGNASFKEVVKKAISLNYQYIGLGDHNPSISSYSLKQIIDQVKKRSEAIKKLKNKYPQIKLLNSLEVDIRANGELALPEKALDLLDYAVISVHSSFSQSQSHMTKRIIAGLSHPKAKILGHPSGRLINQRPGYRLDWEKLFKFCQEKHKIIEINAHPARLDLSDIMVRQAINQKILISINTDAHSLDQMDLIGFGIDVARRGWAEKNHIINALPWSSFRDKMGL